MRRPYTPVLATYLFLISTCAWHTAHADDTADELRSKNLPAKKLPEKKLPGKKLRVKADQLKLDQNTGVQTLSGNVFITQGDFSIRAEVIEVTTVFNGAISRILGTGSPVRFRQQLENGESIETESSEIDYITSSWTLVFRGNVMLQRGNWKLDSDLVEYNIRNRNFRASKKIHTDANTTAAKSRVSFTFGR